MTKPILEVQSLSKSYGQTKVVDGLSFEIAAGECLALLGPSGCGKTTTLRILAGFEKPDSGSIDMSDADMVRLKPYERNLGLVFQDYALFPHMTVVENIEYGMRRRGVAKSDVVARARELILLVQLDGLERRRPAELSGGQQQRVAIARALAPRPALLLLDEPLSNLDARLRLSLRQSLRKILAATGATTLLVTHDQEEAMSMADRIVVLDRGRLQQAGTPTEIYRRPANRFVAEFLGTCLFLAADPVSRSVDGRTSVRLRDGTHLQVATPHTRQATVKPFGIMIRPERMILRNAGAASDERVNRLHARVIAREFLGASEELTLELTTGEIVQLREPSIEAQTAVGASVSLDVPPEACFLTPDGSS
jgi:ABC-type Fe3+/spermidine/putrescine transport system ATPase subunit